MEVARDCGKDNAVCSQNHFLFPLGRAKLYLPDSPSEWRGHVTELWPTEHESDVSHFQTWPLNSPMQSSKLSFTLFGS